MGTYLRLCAGTLLFAIASAQTNECVGDTTCAAAGQVCVDPNYNVASDWVCQCPEYLGFEANTISQVGAQAVGCTQTTACSGKCAGMGCVERPDGSVNCVCTSQSYCYGAGGTSPTVYLDECTAVCPTCADKGAGAGNICYVSAGGGANRQRCTDPVKTAASTADWSCVCLPPATQTQLGAAATCVTGGSQCDAGTFPCLDPDTTSACLDIWGTGTDTRCVCLGGRYNAEGTAATAMTGGCPDLNECTAACSTCASKGDIGIAGSGNICSAFGQTCVDPDTRTTGDWMCVCVGSTLQNTTNTVQPQLCTPVGACANVFCGAGQYCMESGSSYKCNCLPPYVGSSDAAPATCTINECLSDCPHCAGSTCADVGQECVDPSTGIRDWKCKCSATATTATEVALGIVWAQPGPACVYTADCNVNTGGEKCFASGQGCNPVSAGVFACQCIPPYVGTDLQGSAIAGCGYDECSAADTKKICTDAGQTCVDNAFQVPNTWMCVCAVGSGTAKLAPAVCTMDECISVCPTCALTSATATHPCSSVGQVCVDTSTNALSLSNWECRCASGTTNSALMKAATCTVVANSECNAYGEYCAAAGQQCQDITGLTTLGDWKCGCLRSTTVGEQKYATCIYDECAAMGTAECAKGGQLCFELSTAETSLGDWYCKCQTGSGIKLGSLAACTTDACVKQGNTCNPNICVKDPIPMAEQAICTCADAARIAAATRSCTAGARCAAGQPGDLACGAGAPLVTDQGCVDVGATNFKCQCHPPATGSTNDAVATCVLDECTAVCDTCADKATENLCTALGMDCVDPNTSPTSTADWYCKCQAAVGIGQGTALVPQATCTKDECLSNVVCGTDQTCVDPNTAVDSLGDWVCVCANKTGAAVGKMAECADVNECEDNTVCSSVGQVCTEPNPARSSRGDWTCTCVGSTGSAQAAAATCTYPIGSECLTPANSLVCTSRGQACVDGDALNGTYWCQCVSPQTGSNTYKAPATCLDIETDECLIAANSLLCSGSQQTCIDTDKTRMGFWGCACPEGGNWTTGAVTSNCQSPITTYDECQNTCATCGKDICVSGQTCIEGSLTKAMDWSCQCAGSTVKMPAASCLDECATTGQVVCGLTQTCKDEMPKAGSLNDYTCSCKNTNVSRMAELAVCDECQREPCSQGQWCEDPVTTDDSVGDFVCTCQDGRTATGQTAPCADECTNDPCPTSQTCLDEDRFTINSYMCSCVNVIGVNRTGGPAVCDECLLNPCASTLYTQTCVDPNSNDNSTRDYVCSCSNGNVKRTGTVAPCIRNECDDTPCPIPQTCTDTDTNNEGNFVCTCPANTTGTTDLTQSGRPVTPCGTYVDECVACYADPYGECPCGDPRTAVGLLQTQTCSDPVPSSSSLFDYQCTCVDKTTNNFSLVASSGKVPDCTAQATPSPTGGIPSAQRWIFRLDTRLAQGTLLNVTVGAIVRVVNLDANGNLDALYVTCPGCQVLSDIFIHKHCFEYLPAGCESNEYYAANVAVNSLVGGKFTSLEAATYERDGDVLQSAATSTGVFEFLSPDDAVNAKWIEALKADPNKAAMQSDPSVLLVDSVTGGLTAPAVEDDDDDSGLPWWAILLIVLLILLCCSLIIFLIWFCVLRKKKDKETKETKDVEKGKEEEKEMQRVTQEESSAAGWQPSEAAVVPAPMPVAARKSSYQEPVDRGFQRDVNPINTVFPSSSKRESEVIGFGRNLEGQLGIGEADELKVQLAPVEVPDLHGLGINMLSCGSFHSFVVLTDATILAFGEGGDGQLGLGNRLSPKIPTIVSFFKGKLPRLVACGEQHTIVVCNDSVYAFGSGQDGQLGLRDLDDKLVPTAIPEFHGRGGGVEYLACGSHHTCIVVDGKLFSFGWNRYGQLGVGDDEDRNYPTEAEYFRGKTVRDLACGVQHTVVLCDDGVYVTGGNTFGQLGLGHQTDQHIPQRLAFFDGRMVRGISAWFHTMISCDDGVWAFGEGSHHKLGIDQDVPNVETPQLVTAFNDKDVLQVIAGSEHSVVHCTEGVYIWGNGEGGKLGQGHAHPVTDPSFSLLQSLSGHVPSIVAIGVEHTLIYATPK